jgi:hypothetical protein
MADVFAEVKRDLDARNELGTSLYGGPLEVIDKRDWLLEAYQEALDLVIYLRAELMRRGAI